MTDIKQIYTSHQSLALACIFVYYVYNAEMTQVLSQICGVKTLNQC